MARNKKPRKKRTVVKTPKAIKIVDNNGEFRLFKVWNGDKVSKEPFAITDNLEDLVDAYKEACEKYKIKPKIKEIKNIISNHQQQKGVSNEEANFLKSYYD